MTLKWSLGTRIRINFFFSFCPQIQNIGTKQCLDALSTYGKPGMRICHGLGGHQVFLHTKVNELRSVNRCLEPSDLDITYVDDRVNVTLSGCTGLKNQTWTFEVKGHHQGHGRLVHDDSGLCLTFEASGMDEKAKRAEKKSVLQYLANMAVDVIRDIPPPILSRCSEEESQLWALDKPAPWENVSKESNVDGDSP